MAYYHQQSFATNWQIAEEYKQQQRLQQQQKQHKDKIDALTLPQKKNTEKLREDYNKSYISKKNVNSETIVLPSIGDKIIKKTNIMKNINEIKNYTTKKKNKCIKKTKKWYTFGKINHRYKFDCDNNYDTLINKSRNDALNKLYTYSKKKLMKYILKLNKPSDNEKNVNLISKYTKILEEIYGQCKNKDEANNKFNYKNLLKTINNDNELKNSIEYNTAHINYLYEISTPTQKSNFNTVIKQSKFPHKFKKIIEETENGDTLCAVNI